MIPENSKTIIIIFWIVFMIAILLFSAGIIIYLYFRNKSNIEKLKIKQNRFIFNVFCQQFKEVLTFFKAKKVGALFVLKGKQNLFKYLNSQGILIDSLFSPEIIKNIFLYKKTQLHDGAVIIDRNFKINRISAYIAVSKSQPTLKKFGSRHNAAYYLSANSDALIVVVSEINGHITIFCKNNVYISNVNLNKLEKELSYWYYGKKHFKK